MAEPLVPSLPRVDLANVASSLGRIIQWSNLLFRNAEASINRWESGLVTFADSETQATVVLVRKQDDALYNVQATPSSILGAPADLAHTIQSISRQQQSFVVTLKVAPGAGTAITFFWNTFRG